MYTKIRQLNSPRTRRHIKAHHSPGDSGISSDCHRNVHHSPTVKFPSNTVTLPQKCTSQSDSRISVEHNNTATEKYTTASASAGVDCCSNTIPQKCTCTPQADNEISVQPAINDKGDEDGSSGVGVGDGEITGFDV